MQVDELTSNPGQTNTSLVTEKSTSQQPVTNKKMAKYLIVGLVFFPIGAMSMFFFNYFRLRQQFNNQQLALLSIPSSKQSIEMTPTYKKLYLNNFVTMEIPSTWSSVSIGGGEPYFPDYAVSSETILLGDVSLNQANFNILDGSIDDLLSDDKKKEEESLGYINKWSTEVIGGVNAQVLTYECEDDGGCQTKGGVNYYLQIPYYSHNVSNKPMLKTLLITKEPSNDEFERGFLHLLQTIDFHENPYSYKPPTEVRLDVIYPDAQFIEKIEVKPCVVTSEDSTECYGTLGSSGGVRFIYKVQASYKDVVDWYTSKWNMSGGGGHGDSDGESGARTGCTISRSNLDHQLYYLDIIGDKSSTTIYFSSNRFTEASDVL